MTPFRILSQPRSLEPHAPAAPRAPAQRNGNAPLLDGGNGRDGPARNGFELKAAPGAPGTNGHAGTRLAEPAGASGGFYPRRGKRLLNLLVLLLALPFALALALPIALVNALIFADPRRILYSQPRVGHRGRVFQILKFRTMREPSADEFHSWKNGDDGLRVTRFGRFLRNTHLDELPQLINVLRGEMDLVGPRPEMLAIDAWARDHVPGFEDRSALLPGITGYAQITQGYAGMDPRAYARKLEADRYYLENLSLRLDLLILLRTAVWMIRGRGWRHGENPEALGRSSTA